MQNWKAGSRCSDCAAGKTIDNTMAKYAPGQARDEVGRWASGQGNLSYAGLDREGPVTGPGGKVVQPSAPKSSPVDGYKPGRSGGFVASSADRAARAAEDDQPGFSEANLSDAERADFKILRPFQRPGYLDLRRKGWTHADAIGARSTHASISKETTPMTDVLFKCASCATPMEHWRDGSTCRNCVVAKAAKAGAKGAAAAAAKKPAGNGAALNVQSEFPSCPSCGEPSKDGRKCDDCRKGVEREHEQGDLTTEQLRAQAERDKADSEEEGERRNLRNKVRAAMARMLGLDDLAKAAVAAQDLPPMVLKASAAQRFSFAPMYMPGKIDAHDEFVKTGDELQKAAWDYVRKTGSDRTVYLQHIDQPAGEWVEITSWPYPVEAMMTHPGTGQVRKAVLPANTVYMGVIWKPWAWELVQKGRLMGFSMGGWAKRVQAELADESVTKAAGARHPGADEPWDRAGIVNPQHPAARSL
jgi:hypothetical protein